MGITIRKPSAFRSRDCYPLWLSYSRNIKLSTWFLTSRPDHIRTQCYPTTPSIQRIWTFTYTRFRLFPFRSPLLGESSFLSIPQVTEMFHFSWLASRHTPGWQVKPARLPDSGISGSKFTKQLPEAYRSLSRPSSLPGTKASTVSP